MFFSVSIYLDFWADGQLNFKLHFFFLGGGVVCNSKLVVADLKEIYILSATLNQVKSNSKPFGRGVNAKLFRQYFLPFIGLIGAMERNGKRTLKGGGVSWNDPSRRLVGKNTTSDRVEATQYLYVSSRRGEGK